MCLDYTRMIDILLQLFNCTMHGSPRTPNSSIHPPPWIEKRTLDPNDGIVWLTRSTTCESINRFPGQKGTRVLTSTTSSNRRRLLSIAVGLPFAILFLSASWISFYSFGPVPRNWVQVPLYRWKWQKARPGAAPIWIRKGIRKARIYCNGKRFDAKAGEH